MTVKELKAFCDNLVAEGYGDYSVIISDDEEGNGYHDLFYPFMMNQNLIKETIDSTGSWHHITKSKTGYAMLG